MHMADALLSPAAGAVMWLAAGATMALSARRLRPRADDGLVPLMGMLGAFVFALQMVNFSIPATGSSGHLGGGLLLAVLLGPHAAFVVIASVLTVQALFFADGGLLALGANMFNLGVVPCFLAYPLVYRPLAGAAPKPRRAAVAAVVAAVIALQIGALGVVLQTWASGISSLPVHSFLALMLPIHLAIGVVEGSATAALLLFLFRTRPELLCPQVRVEPIRLRPLLVALGTAAVFTGGVLSWFASSQPDGLEWSVARLSGSFAEASPQQGVHATVGEWQRRLAPLPDYALPGPAEPAEAKSGQSKDAWPAVDGGTSLSGLVGGLSTLALVLGVGLALRWRRRRA